MKHGINMAIVIIGTVEKICGMKHDTNMIIAMTRKVELFWYDISMVIAIIARSRKPVV